MSDQTQSSGTASQSEQPPIIVNVSVVRPDQFSPPSMQKGAEMARIGGCGCGCGASNGAGGGV
jgi:hypothetical protein